MPLECFTKCCGCVPLRIGTFILGYLLTLIKTVEFVLTTLNVITLNMLIEKHHITNFNLILVKNILYAVVFIFACQMIMSIYLLVGLHKRQRVHVEMFFKVYAVLMFLYYILFFIVFSLNVKHYTAIQWLIHIPQVVILFYQIYTVFIVVQWTKEMKQREYSGADRAAGVQLSTNIKNSNVVL